MSSIKIIGRPYIRGVRQNVLKPLVGLEIKIDLCRHPVITRVTGNRSDVLLEQNLPRPDDCYVVEGIAIIRAINELGLKMDQRSKKFGNTITWLLNRPHCSALAISKNICQYNP